MRLGRAGGPGSSVRGDDAGEPLRLRGAARPRAPPSRARSLRLEVYGRGFRGADRGRPGLEAPYPWVLPPTRTTLRAGERRLEAPSAPWVDASPFGSLRASPAPSARAGGALPGAAPLRLLPGANVQPRRGRSGLALKLKSHTGVHPAPPLGSRALFNGSQRPRNRSSGRRAPRGTTS